MIWEAAGGGDGAPGVELAVPGGSLPRLFGHRAGMVVPVLADCVAVVESQEGSKATQPRPSLEAAPK